MFLILCNQTNFRNRFVFYYVTTNLYLKNLTYLQKIKRTRMLERFSFFSSFSSFLIFYIYYIYSYNYIISLYILIISFFNQLCLFYLLVVLTIWVYLLLTFRGQLPCLLLVAFILVAFILCLFYRCLPSGVSCLVFCLLPTTLFPLRRDRLGWCPAGTFVLSLVCNADCLPAATPQTTASFRESFPKDQGLV